MSSVADMLSIKGPAIGLSINFVDPISQIITRWEKGNEGGFWGHAFWIVEPGVIASQDWRYSFRPLRDYLKGEHRVKIIADPAWHTPEFAERVAAWREAIDNDVAGRGRYDWLQIVGLRTGLRTLGFPGRYICSGRLAQRLAMLDPEWRDKDVTPTGLNIWTKARRPRYQVLGEYDPIDEQEV